MNVKILPCPYCKAEPIVIDNFDNFFNNKGKYEYRYIMKCSKCGKASISGNGKGVVNGWNRLVEYLTKQMESEVTEND